MRANAQALRADAGEWPGTRVRARTARADERQADLFGAPPASPRIAPKSVRSRREPLPADPPAAEPETATAFAARATGADLDELVTALDDDALAQLAILSARQLKRRLARAGGRQRPNGRGKRPSALDKAGALLATEWAREVEDDGW